MNYLYKVILLTCIFVLASLLTTSYSYETIEHHEEAIRLRILANSDEPPDQAVKLAVRDEVNKLMSVLLADVEDIDEARKIVRSKLHHIGDTVHTTLEQKRRPYSFSVTYEENAFFPEKTYGTKVYPAGEYEAVIISLGKGEGENWWCVVFPNVCLLDFSTSDKVAKQEEMFNNPEEEEEVEVKFFLFEWFDLS